MMQLFPVKTGKQRENFPLVRCVLGSLKRAKLALKNSDILAISSKFVAMSEGRTVKIDSVKPTKKARRLARKLGMNSSFAQLVLDESEKIFSGVEGFVLAIKDGVIAPNAGIDKSNVYPGYAILYPKDCFRSAEKLRTEIFRKTGKKTGIILTDSRLMPTRIGTTGIAVGAAGIEPVINEIGRKDLFGNTLKHTKRNIADDIAAAAQLLMGEANEAVPIVLVRGWRTTERKIRRKEMVIDYRKDIYIRGLKR